MNAESFSRHIAARCDDVGHPKFDPRTFIHTDPLFKKGKCGLALHRTCPGRSFPIDFRLPSVVFQYGVFALDDKVFVLKLAKVVGQQCEPVVPITGD
jgi:hypothetical protein